MYSGGQLTFVLLLLGDSVSLSGPGHRGWREGLGKNDHQDLWGQKTWLKDSAEDQFYLVIEACLALSEPLLLSFMQGSSFQGKQSLLGGNSLGICFMETFGAGVVCLQQRLWSGSRVSVSVLWLGVCHPEGLLRVGLTPMVDGPQVQACPKLCCLPKVVF